MWRNIVAESHGWMIFEGIDGIVDFRIVCAEMTDE